MDVEQKKTAETRTEAPAHHARDRRIMDLRTLCAAAIETYDAAADVTRPSIALMIARLQDEIALTTRKSLVRLREDSPLSWVDRWSPKDPAGAIRRRFAKS